MEQNSFSREKGGGRESTHDYRHAGFKVLTLKKNRLHS